MSIPLGLNAVVTPSAAMAKKRAVIYRMAICAMFLGLTLVMKLVSTTYLPVLGAAGIKISVSGVISVFPSLLF